MAHTKGVCFCVFEFRSTFSEFNTHQGLWLSLLSVRFIDFNKNLDRRALHSLAPILARWPLVWLQGKKNPLWPWKSIFSKDCHYKRQLKLQTRLITPLSIMTFLIHGGFTSHSSTGENSSAHNQWAGNCRGVRACWAFPIGCPPVNNPLMEVTSLIHRCSQVNKQEWR